MTLSPSGVVEAAVEVEVEGGGVDRRAQVEVVGEAVAVGVVEAAVQVEVEAGRVDHRAQVAVVGDRVEVAVDHSRSDRRCRRRR